MEAYTGLERQGGVLVAWKSIVETKNLEKGETAATTSITKSPGCPLKGTNISNFIG